MDWKLVLILKQDMHKEGREEGGGGGKEEGRKRREKEDRWNKG